MGMTRGKGALGKLGYTGGPVERSVFVSYTTHSEADLEARGRVLEVLDPICHVRTIQGDPWAVWVDDRKLNAGDDWKRRIEDALSHASLFIVLMSRKFLNSTFCMKTELPVILSRHAKDRVPVLGVLLDEVAPAQFLAHLGHDGPMSLQELQCLPRGPRRDGLLAVSQWPKARKSAEAWAAIDQEIQRAWPPALPVSAVPQAAPRRPVTGLTEPARFTPFRCDRRKAADGLADALEHWKNRPLLVLSEGRQEDCLWQWAERMARHEFVQRMDEFKRDDVQFPDPVTLEWPPEVAHAEAGLAAWKRYLAEKYEVSTRMSLAELPAIQGGQPVFWVTELHTTDKAREVMPALEGLIALLSGWPDQPPQRLVFMVIHLVRPGSAFATSPSLLTRTMTRRLDEASAQGRVQAACLGCLPEVQANDVRPWLSVPDVKRHLPATDLASLPHRLGFDQPGKVMPMQTFAAGVHAWLQDEARA